MTALLTMAFIFSFGLIVLPCIYIVYILAIILKALICSIFGIVEQNFFEDLKWERDMYNIHHDHEISYCELLVRKCINAFLTKNEKEELE